MPFLYIVPFVVTTYGLFANGPEQAQFNAAVSMFCLLRLGEIALCFLTGFED